MKKDISGWAEGHAVHRKALGPGRKTVAERIVRKRFGGANAPFDDRDRDAGSRAKNNRAFIGTPGAVIYREG